MKTLKFMGYSDDTFGEYGVSNLDVDNCASGKPIQYRVTCGNEGLVITGQYNRFNNGCWDIGIGQLDEDIPLPKWNMRFSMHAYSTVLEIDVPDETILESFNNGKIIDKTTLNFLHQ